MPEACNLVPEGQIYIQICNEYTSETIIVENAKRNSIANSPGTAAERLVRHTLIAKR